MEQLAEGLNLSHGGDSADAAMAAFHRQIGLWSVALPPVEPLVLDFGLGRFDRVGLIEYWIANELDAGYCGKYLFVFDKQQCPAHSHRVKHETFHVVRGCLGVTLEGRSIMLRSGQTLPVPPGQVHSFQGDGGSCLLLELSMPCDIRDNYFEDPQIAAWLRCHS